MTFLFTSFCCCCSVTKSCLTLCDPMGYSLSGYAVVHGIVISSEAPLNRDSFSDFPYFWWPWWFWRVLVKNTGQVFCGMSLSLGFSDVFLMFRLELWRIDRKQQNQVSFFIASYQKNILSIWLITGVNLDHLTEATFSSFLHCKLYFFLSSILFHLLLGRKSWSTARAQSGVLCYTSWGGGSDFCIQFLISSLREICLFSLINFLVQSLFIKYGLMDINWYFMLWSKPPHPLQPLLHSPPKHMH